ncbi:hypothetical protein BY458DRAFT_466251 [Sporodiniella umbellata]|nr:hypothetical protein BY458DRAFT_466251 [Sporodiniella umbellata]
MQVATTELEFNKHYLDALSTKSVRYGKDYLAQELPSPLRIKRQPVSHEEAVATPSEGQATTTATTDRFQLSVKVLKPSFHFSIGGLVPTDTVAHLKQRIYQQQSAYPVQRQRLLVKGKVLSDTKSLNELGLQDESVVHLMLTAVPKTGRWGISMGTEEKLSEPAFWVAVEKVLVEQVGETDGAILLSKVKGSLTA